MSDNNFIEAKKGDYIYFDSHFHNKLYFIKDGFIKIGYVNDSGEEIIKEIIHKGEIFGQFTLEKNKRSLLQNLIQINYSSDNLTMLIGITWEHKKSKAWRNKVLMKFLHHSNLAPSNFEA